MEHIWDLSILYTGFDDPAFARDLEELDRQIEAAKALSDRADNDDPAAFLRAYLAWGEALSDVTNRLMIFCSLRSSANTGDMEATSAMGRIMNRLSATAGPETHMKEVIAGMEDLETILKENDDLTPFTYLLTSIKKESRYLLSGKEETLFSRLNISGASAWEDLHSALTSTVKADYRGEKITLSTVRNLAYDPDPAVRRDAYEAELACYEPIRESVAFALNSIKMQVITECDIRGYASPLDKALKSSRMKRETLDALLGAMDEYLPRFWQYLRAKAKMLG
ncbi:MAG: peptidase M3, partial [Clostridia bacterium]|nr:peptidase M3 [Clostridia bacterium]